MNMQFPKLKISVCYSLPMWLSGKESAVQCRRCKRRGFNPWVKKIPWSRNWQLTVVFSGKFHGERKLWATVHRVTRLNTCMHANVILLFHLGTFCNVICPMYLRESDMPQIPGPWKHHWILGGFIFLWKACIFLRPPMYLPLPLIHASW